MRTHKLMSHRRAEAEHPVSGPTGNGTAQDSTRPDAVRAQADPMLDRSREMDELWAGPSVGVLTPAQRRGLILGSIIGGLIGAVVLLPLALIHFADLAAVWRIVIVVAAGLLGGATAGALYLGGRLPELEGEVDPDARSEK